MIGERAREARIAGFSANVIDIGDAPRIVDGLDRKRISSSKSQRSARDRHVGLTARLAAMTCDQIADLLHARATAGAGLTRLRDALHRAVAATDLGQDGAARDGFAEADDHDRGAILKVIFKTTDHVTWSDRAGKGIRAEPSAGLFAGDLRGR
jgi:hypothetical protein